MSGRVEYSDPKVVFTGDLNGDGREDKIEARQNKDRYRDVRFSASLGGGYGRQDIESSYYVAPLLYPFSRRAERICFRDRSAVFHDSMGRTFRPGDPIKILDVEGPIDSICVSLGWSDEPLSNRTFNWAIRWFWLLPTSMAVHNSNYNVRFLSAHIVTQDPCGHVTGEAVAPLDKVK